MIKDIYKFFENQNIQGPKPIPFIGTWRGSVKKFLGDEDISLTKQYGKIVGTFDGLTPNVAITQPDIIKQILSLSTDNFHDRRVSKNVCLINFKGKIINDHCFWIRIEFLTSVQENKFLGVGFFFILNVILFSSWCKLF